MASTGTIAVTCATAAMGGRVARRLAERGAPDWEVEGWVTTYVATAKREMDVVTDTAQRILGRPAAELDAFLRANPDLWQHLLTIT